MKPIVVGVNPGRPVSAALNWATAEARSRRRRLELRIARGVPVPAQADVPIDSLVPDSVAAEAIAEAVAHVTQLDPTVQVDGRICEGSAGTVLVSASREAELVVVGRHGHGRLTEFLLGSASAQVAAHAEAPVAVVNEDQMPLRKNGAVAVGVDGSVANRAAIDFSFEAADRRGAPLVAIYAWQLNVPENLTLPWKSTEGMRDLAQDQQRMLHEALAGWSSRFPDVEVRYVVSRQHAIDRLSEEARRASLLVIGGRGRGGFAGLRIGSVSRGILHRPHTCPIVFVHGSDPNAGR
ncbi:MAG: universal stress protein [Ornithinimicrobium sp.]